MAAEPHHDLDPDLESSDKESGGEHELTVPKQAADATDEIEPAVPDRAPIERYSKLYGDDVPLSTVRYVLAQSNASNRPLANALNPLPLDREFKPLQLKKERCTKKGRPNRLILRNEQMHSVMGIFARFFPESMLEKIAKNKNIYAEEKSAGYGRLWRATTVHELKAFIGILLYMGIFKTPRLEDYWDCSGRMPIHRITDCMTLYRFQQLKRYLHVSHPTLDGSDEYFFNKVEPLLSHVRDESKALWIPAYQLSADEIMIMNYGRSSETVRMRNKPIGAVFKFWAISDAGYVFKFYPHSTRYPWRDAVAYKRKLPHSSAVVARLCDDLPRAVPGLEGEVQYVLYVDNYFSSPKLFADLRKRGIGAAGTARSNATGFPKELALRGRSGVRLPWNTLGTKRCLDGSVLALTWMDNGPVQMLTTVHSVSQSETVERNRKSPHLTSTNGPSVREVFGDSSRKVLAIRKVVDDYNYFMGGVDIADQLRAAYTSHMPSRRTWLPLFFWFIDTAATNSYIMLSGLKSGWDNQHREFKLQLSHELVGASRPRTIETRMNGGSSHSKVPLKMEKKAEAGGYVKPKYPELPHMACNEFHFPEAVGHDARRLCYNCRLKKRTPARASVRCLSCGLFLCLTKARNCFAEIHQEVLGKQEEPTPGT